MMVAKLTSLPPSLRACPRPSKACEDGAARMEEWEFRDRLRRLIEEKGLSARKMSRRLGRNDSYIQNILSGGALPSMRMFLKICAFLRITPETFWSGGADAGGVLVQKLRRLDERQLGVLSALVDILTAAERPKP